VNIWPTVTLVSVAAVFNGKTPSVSEQRSDGNPVLKIKDVDEHGKFSGKFDSFVDHVFAFRYANKKIETDDVLILNAAHNADYVGSKLFFADAQVNGAFATGE
jgi:type I restriction enzyme S subunit